LISNTELKQASKIIDRESTCVLSVPAGGQAALKTALNVKIDKVNARGSLEEFDACYDLVRTGHNIEYEVR
jgi:hypothetical protein